MYTKGTGNGFALIFISIFILCVIALFFLIRTYKNLDNSPQKNDDTVVIQKYSESSAIAQINKDNEETIKFLLGN